MDLFEYAKSKTLDQESPLASRLRPTTLDEVVGQQHIIGKDTLLYRAIKADKLTSVIFYGPPGTGKTTLAKVIANTTSAEFTQINATVAGKKDMEAVVKEAQQNLGMYGKKTILFIDEIHRFNKGQQDYLLPFVEDGTIILIGATTENPYFEVNAALLSRSIIFELKSLKISEVKELLLRAVNDKTKGMGNYKARIDEDALDFLADMAVGAARNALTAIETLHILQQSGFPIPETAIQAALPTVQLPARVQILQKDPLVLMDGGHNASGVAALTEVLKDYGKHPIIAILGMVKGKDYQTAVKELSEVLDVVFCVDDFSPQAVPAIELAACFPPTISTTCLPHKAAFQAALEQAKQNHGCVVISGSLYLSSAFLEQDSIQL